MHHDYFDPKLQWSQFWNIWHNAAMRTVIYKLLTPVHWIRQRAQAKNVRANH
jgi:hypothetical protein